MAVEHAVHAVRQDCSTRCFTRIDPMELAFLAFVGSLALIAAMVVKGEI